MLGPFFETGSAATAVLKSCRVESRIMRQTEIRRAVQILGCVLIAAVVARPQASRPILTLLQEIRSHRKGTAVWWVGNAGWLIKSDDLLIGIDLDLSPEEKIQPPPIAANDLASEIDIAFVSHHHGDHCNVPTIRTLAQHGKCIFVLPRHCLKQVSEVEIPADRIIV